MHIFQCGVLDNRAKGEVFIERVLRMEESQRNEVMDEMVKRIPPAPKGVKVWDTFWSTQEKETKFLKVLRDEIARRVSDAGVIREFGLAALIVNEATNTVSSGVFLTTSCKTIEDFFRERKLTMYADFVFPTDEARENPGEWEKAFEKMEELYEKLVWYWGAKQPSFKWLEYVTQLKVSMLELEVNALHKMFQSRRVLGYKARPVTITN
jgi:hypothetical protein